MPISVACEHCGKAYQVSSKFAGKKAKCQACGKSFVIAAAKVAVPVAGGVDGVPAVQGEAAEGACPQCQGPMDAAAVLCVHCGFDRRTNRSLKATVATGGAVGAGSGRPVQFKTLAGAIAFCLFAMALCFGMAAYEYYDLGEFERQGGRRTMNSLVKLVYDIGGRNGVVGMFALFGALAPVVIVMDVIRRRRGGAK
jgi:hypothetical protein